jgi:hypothetical protein
MWPRYFIITGLSSLDFEPWKMRNIPWVSAFLVWKTLFRIHLPFFPEPPYSRAPSLAVSAIGVGTRWNEFRFNQCEIRSIPSPLGLGGSGLGIFLEG